MMSCGGYRYGCWCVTYVLSLIHVVDVSVNRKVENLAPSYLRKVAAATRRTASVEGGNQERFETVTKTERGINMRFYYASRRLQVPHIHPGYVFAVHAQYLRAGGTQLEGGRIQYH